jgi:hypothetical protein
MVVLSPITVWSMQPVLEPEMVPEKGGCGDDHSFALGIAGCPVGECGRTPLIGEHPDSLRGEVEEGGRNGGRTHPVLGRCSHVGLVVRKPKFIEPQVKAEP